MAMTTVLVKMFVEFLASLRPVSGFVSTLVNAHRSAERVLCPAYVSKMSAVLASIKTAYNME